MNWVTVFCSGIATACLTLAAIHGLLWWRHRRAWGQAVFAGTALMVAVLAGLECMVMAATTAEEHGRLLRWVHVPAFFGVVGLVLFTRLYLRAGRWWLAWAVVVVRLLVLIANFLLPENLNFRTMGAPRWVSFLGEQVAVPDGEPSAWMAAGTVSLLLLAVYLGDATVATWRRGDRRRAFWVGGSMLLFVLLPAVSSVFVVLEWHDWPLMISPFYLGFIVVMACELSRELAEAARVTERLQASEAALREGVQRMDLAARAANLAYWSWDISRDVIWVSDHGRELYGVARGEAIDFGRFLATLHPDDVPRVRAAVEDSLRRDGRFHAEYRVRLRGGAERWIVADGQAEFDAAGQPVRMRGVSLDVTARRRAELEADRQRGELMHLARVATLNELSGSLAHELNQPLGIILSNAQAAQRLLAQEPPDVAEVRAILAEIVSEDRRAGEVIQRLRAWLRRDASSMVPVCVNEVVGEVLRLARGDILARGSAVEHEAGPDLPPVLGDRVQLQQVLLNLLLNAGEAMAARPVEERRVVVRSVRDGGLVRISISDAGNGLPADVEAVFKPFYTTKSHGLGLGLAISRSIVEAHKGRLWAGPGPAGRGATFHVELPAAGKERA